MRQQRPAHLDGRHRLASRRAPQRRAPVESLDDAVTQGTQLGARQGAVPPPEEPLGRPERVGRVVRGLALGCSSDEELEGFLLSMFFFLFFRVFFLVVRMNFFFFFRLFFFSSSSSSFFFSSSSSSSSPTHRVDGDPRRRRDRGPPAAAVGVRDDDGTPRVDAVDGDARVGRAEVEADRERAGRVGVGVAVGGDGAETTKRATTTSACVVVVAEQGNRRSRGDDDPRSRRCSAARHESEGCTRQRACRRHRAFVEGAKKKKTTTGGVFLSRIRRPKKSSDESK